MKLPGTWATVNNVRRYVPAPESPVLRAHDLTRPPKRRIVAATHGWTWTPPPGFIHACSRQGLDGNRIAADHARQQARLQAADYDRPVPTRYALSLLREREATGSDGVRMAASFHAGRLAELISENKIDLARVAGFDCDVTPD